MERTIDLKDRVQGALLGFAIGDAMGATTEFMNSAEIRKKYGIVKDIIGGGWLHLNPGEVTDDTQMMLCVYRGIRDGNGSLNRTLDLICKEFREWADSFPPDIGGACYRAIYGTNEISASKWRKANRDRQRLTGVKDYGNGGLMRCLVPCLMDKLDLAVNQSALTHTNVLCNIQVKLYYDALWKALNDCKPADIEWHEPTGHALNTERNAEFWLGSTNSFEEAIIGAVNDGGDADTIAALTGGLAGAYYGAKAIPSRWVQQLYPKTVMALMVVSEYILAQYRSKM